MTFLYNEKNVEQKLLEVEKAELLEYCQSQGYTEAQTEMFINNTLKQSEDIYLGE